jgi:hypothetical protein
MRTCLQFIKWLVPSVLVDDGVQVAFALLDVAHDSARQPRVCVRVHEQLEMEQVAQLGEVENQNALD